MTGARTRSALFRYIEDLHGDRPWGEFLDAGTGTHSIGWIGTRNTRRWTAVSGAAGHAALVERASAGFRRAGDRILLGNWADPDFLAGERYDTVLADYLLGAVEGFAPYFQSALFSRLRQLTAGRLYITGVEPYVNAAPPDEAGRLVWRIGRYRDACLLHAGEIHYREYPLDWTLRVVEASGFRPIAARRFPNRYKAGFVNSQIDMALMRVERLEDRLLAEALAAHGAALREEALAVVAREGSLRHGFDYVIGAEPV